MVVDKLGDRQERRGSHRSNWGLNKVLAVTAVSLRPQWRLSMGPSPTARKVHLSRDLRVGRGRERARTSGDRHQRGGGAADSSSNTPAAMNQRLKLEIQCVLVELDGLYRNPAPVAPVSCVCLRQETRKKQ